MLVNPCYHSNFCSEVEVVSFSTLKTWSMASSEREASWKTQEHFQRKVRRPCKKRPFSFFKVSTDSLPPPQRKSHGADCYTCTAMTPSTVGPLCPTGFESKSPAKWAHSRQEGVQFSRHLGRGGFIHHNDMLACQPALIKHWRTLGGGFIPGSIKIMSQGNCKTSG